MNPLWLALQLHRLPVEVLVEPGMYHGADELAAHVPRMQAFREAMRDALRRAIG